MNPDSRREFRCMCLPEYECSEGSHGVDRCRVELRVIVFVDGREHLRRHVFRVYHVFHAHGHAMKRTTSLGRDGVQRPCRGQDELRIEV